ncbi:hypothetical protein V1524DRAFT_409958 [Lipomyces starkeyi]
MSAGAGVLNFSVFCKRRDLQQISLLKGCKERKRDETMSTFGYINSKSRNRLKDSSVETLVFLYANAAVEDLGRRWFNEEEEPEIDDGEQIDEEPIEEMVR